MEQRHDQQGAVGWSELVGLKGKRRRCTEKWRLFGRSMSGACGQLASAASASSGVPMHASIRCLRPASAATGERAPGLACTMLASEAARLPWLSGTPCGGCIKRGGNWWVIREAGSRTVNESKLKTEFFPQCLHVFFGALGRRWLDRLAQLCRGSAHLGPRGGATGVQEQRLVIGLWRVLR